MERDNTLEWVNRTDNKIKFTLNQVKFKNKIKKLAETHDSIEYTQNEDGSISGTFPVEFLKIDEPKHRKLSEEQRRSIAKRFENTRKQKGGE